ncbi:hypothetical protein LIER_22074 [Lithospermum erythrorhizon]|uniref:Homer protein n=1 Tax=Lithospermum erythrorhizon TaxID=34254 RepID=A0AAV3QU25_LITER
MVTINLSLIPCPKPKHFFINKLKNTKIFTLPSSFDVPKSLSTMCNIQKSNNVTGNMNDVLSGMVDKRVEELLNKEENKELLHELEKASQRVELAKRELEEIKRQEAAVKLMRDYINLLESRTSEIAECQQDISEARAMIEEAERSLDNNGSAGNETLIKNEERLESTKAALISAFTGSLVGLPIALTRVTSNAELLLPLVITFVSCALFGVTFRYVVRRDLDDFHLKTGVCAAFGFVKGLATLDGGAPLELDTSSFLSHASSAVICVSEEVLIFLLASVALELCMKLRILSPFPIDRSSR